jgi:hypothetical protein
LSCLPFDEELYVHSQAFIRVEQLYLDNKLTTYLLVVTIQNCIVQYVCIGIRAKQNKDLRRKGNISSKNDTKNRFLRGERSFGDILW